MQVVENQDGADEHKPSQKSLPSFKLDLSKCHTETDIGEVAIDIDTDIQLKSSHRKGSDVQQQQTPKKETETRQEKQQLSPKPQVHILRKQQQPVQPKAIFIPRLAL